MGGCVLKRYYMMPQGQITAHSTNQHMATENTHFPSLYTDEKRPYPSGEVPLDLSQQLVEDQQPFVGKGVPEAGNSEPASRLDNEPH